jgi:hypothetical protein
MFILTPTKNGARSLLLPKKIPGERSLIMPNWVTGICHNLERQSEVILLSY